MKHICHVWYEEQCKSPECEIDDYITLSKHKTIFAKSYAPNWSEEVFVIKKVKNTAPWTYAIEDLNGEELLERFMKKNCKREVKENLA